MKNTSKLIGIVSALIVVILAVFLVTKFNSHVSARVSTSSSPAKTVKKSSSSSSKAVKKDKKNSNPHVKNEDTEDTTVEVSEPSVAKDSATKDTNETVLSSGSVSETTKEKTGEETQTSSLNGKQLSSGDYSSIAGTWTNSRGEFVTISPDGTVQNGSGYTYHLYSGHLNNGNFSGTIASDIDSAAFWAIPGTGNGDSDHLVIGQSDDAENYPFYRN